MKEAPAALPFARSARTLLPPGRRTSARIGNLASEHGAGMALVETVETHLMHTRILNRHAVAWPAQHAAK